MICRDKGYNVSSMLEIGYFPSLCKINRNYEFFYFVLVWKPLLLSWKATTHYHKALDLSFFLSFELLFIWMLLHICLTDWHATSNGVPGWHLHIYYCHLKLKYVNGSKYVIFSYSHRSNVCCMIFSKKKMCVVWFSTYPFLHISL